MRYAIVFKHKYFPLLLFKTVLIIIIVSQLGLFSYINHFIYNLILPLLPYTNNNFKEFVLVDASDTKRSDLIETIYKISSYKPKNIISDTFHKDLSLNESNISVIFQENKNFVFSIPIAQLEDKAKELIPFGNVIYVYNFHKLYDNSGYIFNRDSQYKDLLTLFNTNTLNLSHLDRKYINYNGNPPLVKVHADDIVQDSVISDFFHNKIVIISNFDNSYIPSEYSVLFNQDFIHQSHMAHMINSFMSGDWLREFNLWEYYLFIIIATIVWILILYKLSFLYITYAFFISLIF